MQCTNAANFGESKQLEATGEFLQQMGGSLPTTVQHRIQQSLQLGKQCMALQTVSSKLCPGDFIFSLYCSFRLIWPNTTQECTTLREKEKASTRKIADLEKELAGTKARIARSGQPNCYLVRL